MGRVIQGVIPILPTPFVEGGEIDMSSFLCAIDTAIRHKAAGVAMFGLASEYYKLSDAERFRCTSALIQHVARRVPVIVSIVAHSTEVAVKDAKFAEHEGADAVMVLPPFFLSPSADWYDGTFWRSPQQYRFLLIIQYAPAQTGYPIDAGSFVRMRDDAPNITCIKVDQVPAGPMVQDLREPRDGLGCWVYGDEPTSRLRVWSHQESCPLCRFAQRSSSFGSCFGVRTPAR